MRIGSAHLMAGLALFISLGGTGYAVTQLPKNSVGSTQLRAGAVTNAKLAKGSVTSEKLASGTVVTGPRGPRGAEGPAGTNGKDGANGAPGPAATEVRNPAVFRAHNVDAQIPPAPNTNRTLILRAEDFDDNGVFDPATSHFKAPRDGYYFFYASAVLFADGSTAHRFFTSIVAADPSKSIRGTDTSQLGYQQSNVSGILRLQRGDEVWAAVYRERAIGLATDLDYGPATQFGGYFISPL